MEMYLVDTDWCAIVIPSSTLEPCVDLRDVAGEDSTAQAREGKAGAVYPSENGR